MPIWLKQFSWLDWPVCWLDFYFGKKFQDRLPWKCGATQFWFISFVLGFRWKYLTGLQTDLLMGFFHIFHQLFQLTFFYCGGCEGFSGNDNSKNRIRLSPCLSSFTSVHGATMSNVSRLVWPRTNRPPGASSLGKLGSSRSCCAKEFERRPMFFSP